MATQHFFTTLHITNDETLAKKIKAAGIEGDTIAWQDALYEGPVVKDLSLDELSMVRAEYFARLGWSNNDEIKHRFRLRNEKLKTFSRYQEVVLWFDHNLYNQLQLLQIISWFASQNTRHLLLSLICIDRFPGVKHFFGINSLGEEQLIQLVPKKTEITMAQINVCVKGWRALTSPHPDALLTFYPADMSSMPFLKNAIARLIQEFPAKANGLSQTESLILQALLAHLTEPDDIYQFVQHKEPVPFMSRAMFYGCLQKLTSCRVPAIEKQAVETEEVIDSESETVCEVETTHIVHFTLAQTARQVLYNWVDWIQLNGINRWIGGVHLQEGNIWRYNKETRTLKKTYL